MRRTGFYVQLYEPPTHHVLHISRKIPITYHLHLTCINMMADMVALVVANFLSWGHWPICAKFARAPVQPFGVVMVLSQTLFAWVACLLHGAAFTDAFQEDSGHAVAILSVVVGGAALAIGDFSAAAAIERLGVAVGGPVCFSCMLVCGSIGDYLVDGSAHPGLLFGGIAGCIGAVVADSQSHASSSADEGLSLAKNDSKATDVSETSTAEVPPTPPAAQQLELELELPRDAEIGALQDISLEPGQELSRAARPRPLSATPATADQPAVSQRRSQFQLGMLVAVVGGCIGGMWTVLSTVASYLHALHPLVLLFYFHLGEVLFIVPVVLLYGRLFDGVTSPRALMRQIRALTRRQAAWTSGAGACIATGYLCYFATKDGVPRPVMFAFGCAAGTRPQRLNLATGILLTATPPCPPCHPSHTETTPQHIFYPRARYTGATGMIWGLGFFGEYTGAAKHKKLLLLALVLYPSSITLIARSMD